MKKIYWFPAKRYTWGWGFPTAWQGKAVLAVFLLLFLAGVVFVWPAYGGSICVVYSGTLALVLIGICLVKGEPPKWGRK